jgi:signal transduction histidine kinase
MSQESRNSAAQGESCSSAEQEQIRALTEALQKLKKERAQQHELVCQIIDAAPAIMWIEDNNGQIQFLSPLGKLEEESHFPAAVIRENGWLEAIQSNRTAEVSPQLMVSGLPANQVDHRLEWQRNIQNKQAFEIDLPLADGLTGVRWYRLTARPAADSAFAMPGWFGSCRCIDDEKRLEAALSKAVKSRSDFVAHVSHELRTPLNGILPMVEILLRAEMTDEARARVLMLKEAGHSLLSIINNVLDFSKLESGKTLVDSVEFDLIALVERVAQIFSPAAAQKEKGLLLLSSIAANVPERVTGDPQRISQALCNLCGNAVKFTDRGVVALSVRCEDAGLSGHRLTFAVTDSGPGLGPDLQQRLFEPFFQGSGSTFRDHAGTGLGLSITKRLVELMGGSNEVQSEPDLGASFSFSIPVGMAAGPPSLALSNLSASVADTGKFSSASACAGGAECDRPRLLTFEPMSRGSWFIAEALRNFAVRVESTDNIAAALGTLKRNSFAEVDRQILVLDMVRFRKKSEELLRRLANSGLAGSVRVIEVVASDNACPESDSDDSRILLPMPLKRQSVLKCLALGKAPKFTAVRSRNQADAVPREITPVAPLASKLPSQGPKKVALVADDNQIARQVAAIFLTDLGFEVNLAADGVEAIQAFKSRTYDMVFLDCQMPHIDGFEVAQIVKEIQRRKGISVPVVALTASAVEGSREECLARGMDDYLSKPIEPQALERLIENWIGPLNRAANWRTSQSLPVVSLQSAKCGVNIQKLLQKFSEAHLRKLLETFVQTSAVDLRQLEDSLEGAASPEGLADFGRRLDSYRNSLLIVEAPQLADVCLEVARALAAGQVVEARRGLNKLAQSVESLREELTQVLADRSTMTLPAL